MQEQGVYAHSAIQQQVESATLTPEDKRFAAALVIGVVRTQGALDALLDQFLDKPQGVRPDTRRALQMATYEMLFMGHAPQHAVDQGVRLVGKSAPYAKGLANAVLRRVAAEADAFPFEDANSSWEAFCMNEGFPLELARSLADDLGEARARKLISEAKKRPPVFLHVNAIKSTTDAVLVHLDHKGIQATAVDEVPGCILLERNQDVASRAIEALMDEGKVIVSDLAAQLVAWACVRDGCPESFLEVGAGRGTKTVLVQSIAHALYGHQVPTYTCVDASPSKVCLLQDRAERYGVHVDECIAADGRTLTSVLPNRAFGTVFLDAPCSGLGTLRRHPEIPWRQTAEDRADLSRLQLDLLASCASVTAPQGRLVYATCTPTRAEDGAVIDAFLSSSAGNAYRVEGGFATVSDGWGADYHFCCVMQRTS